MRRRNSSLVLATNLSPSSTTTLVPLRSPKNPVHHERSKHIGLRHHFLRERVEDNTISLSHVPSADNIADLLTKGLPRELFDRLRDLLGVTARSDRVSG